MRYLIRDGWTWAYATILVAALALSSEALHTFFVLLLPRDWLALPATVVLAAGIPVLKWAARFERKPGHKALLWAALLAFLGVELLAQYFKGQAGFATSVREQATLVGSDLAAAAANPLWSRVLTVLFLASLPLVVVLMVDRLADRVLTLRTHVAGVRRYARFRRRAARLRRAGADLRRLLAGAREQTAEYRNLWTTEREEFAHAREIFADTSRSLADERAAHATTREELENHARRLADERAAHATTREERDHARGLAVQLRAQLDDEQRRPVLDVATAAQLLIDAGAPEATIRGWRESGRLRLATTTTTEEV